MSHHDAGTDSPRASRSPDGGRRLFVRALVLALVAVLLIATGAGVWTWRTLYGEQIVAGAEPVHFVVPDGASLHEVAAGLEREGLLERPWALRLVARLEGGARRIRAGEYELPPGASPAHLLHLLVDGPLLTRAITLPEGWTAARTVAALADSLHIDPAPLERLVEDPPESWRTRLGIPEGHGLEGYLFPETYRFARGIPPRRVIETLLATLEEALDDSLRKAVEDHPYDLHEVLTLASIVEAEATRDDERSRIAAVYLNRLRRGWKLEADPTVAFATDKVGERLLYRDLEVDSPYNTYRHGGLPPGPINSPGLASIRAVLAPEPDFEAMYFVADGEGGHRFSRTWEEHRRAVERYREVQRRQRREQGRDGSG